MFASRCASFWPTHPFLPYVAPHFFPYLTFDSCFGCFAFKDGSSVTLRPSAIYPDPLRPVDVLSLLILCDARADGPAAKSVMDRVASAEPWFGIEQQFFLPTPPKALRLRPEGDSIEITRAQREELRDAEYAVSCMPLVHAHAEACRFAGIGLLSSGGNEEGERWYRLGPCRGSESSDHLIISRFLLRLIASQFGVEVEIAQRPYAFLLDDNAPL